MQRASEISGYCLVPAPAATMFQELKFQLSTAILTILTLAAGVSAFINFQQQNRFRLPEDGVIWVESKGSVEALFVKQASPGRNAGIHPTDRLLDIDGVKIERATDVAKVLVRIGAWSRARLTWRCPIRPS